MGRRLLGLAAALALVAGTGVGPTRALAPADQLPVGPVTSPALDRSSFSWTSAGRPNARLYARGTPSGGQPVISRSAGPGIGGVAGNVAPAGQRPGPRPAPGTARPAALSPPIQASLTAAPDQHVAGFAGLGESDQVAPGTEPANSTIAVGPEQVVQMTNSRIRITDRSGNALVSDTAVASFFSVPAGFFDRQPRVVYDSLHGRFIATETSWDCVSDPGNPVFPATFGHGYVDLAVSQTSDPTGNWNLFFWGYQDRLPTEPAIGTSTDKLAVSDALVSMTKGDGGAGDGSCANAPTAYAGDLLIANWADVIADNASTLLSSEFVAADPFLATGLTAALQTPATDPTLYVVARSGEAATNNDVIVSTFTGTTTKNVGVTSADSWDLTSAGVTAPFANPPAAHEPGSPGTLTSGIDGNPQAALWKAGQLSWATTYPCTPSGDSSTRDCVRVSQLSTAGAFSEPTPEQDFLLARNGFDSYLPGIGQSGDGTLDLVYTQSNGTGSNYPSSYEQYQRPGDGPNSISPPYLLAAGTGSDAGGAWGAYLGLAQDPQVAASVWQANATSNASGWTTFVDRLGSTAASTYVPITSVRVVDTRTGGVNGLSGLAGKFLANTARSFQVAGLGSISSAAVAVTGNLAVTGQTGAGYIAITPDLTNTPSSSTLNFPAGDVRANNVTIPLNAAGGLAAVYKASAGRTADLVFDVTGYFVTGTGQAHYVTLPPVRALDSRLGTGLAGGTPARFVAGNPVSLQVSGATGVAGIPADAVAITGNLTVTGQTRAGYLSVTTDPTSSPVTSTLNFPLGDARANGFTVRLNGSGQLSIVYIGAGGTTDVVVDITGYFTALPGLSFYPLNPGRVMDTRAGVSNSGLTGTFLANVARTLAVDGHWGVPPGAGAITGNLTVTGQTAAGFVAMTPDPTDMPSTSTLNFPLGDSRANGFFGPLGATGSASFVYKTRNARTVQLILDVSGYFK